MSSKQAILGRIRANIAPTGDDASRRQVADKRLSSHPKGIIPAGPERKQELVKRFVERAEAAAASVETVSRKEIARAISRFLRDHNLPQRLRRGVDRRLTKIDWPQRGGPEIATGPSDGSDLVGLSHALGGVAETGTLILTSGTDNPSTLNFLPENHIVLVDADDITGSYEEIWTRVRRRFGKGKMPRTLNMITGPSRSADIEQTLILGAHGPIRLHIIVVKS